MSELKIWLAVRTDLDMPVGKMMAQAGHGFLGTFEHARMVRPEVADHYMKGAVTKIAVRVGGESDLERVRNECEIANIPYYLVRDAGRTVFDQPTLTVCGFGPATVEELTPFLRRLRLF